MNIGFSNDVYRDIVEILRADPRGAKFGLNIAQLGGAFKERPLLDIIRYEHDYRAYIESRLDEPFEGPGAVVDYQNTMLAPAGGRINPFTAGYRTDDTYKTIGFSMLADCLNRNIFTTHPSFTTLTPGLTPDAFLNKLIDQMANCPRQLLSHKVSAAIIDETGATKNNGRISILNGGNTTPHRRLATYAYGKSVQSSFKDDIITAVSLCMFNMHANRLTLLLATALPQEHPLTVEEEEELYGIMRPARYTQTVN